jgi:hypothetical protein
MLNLVEGITARGLPVDIVLAAAEGAFLDHLPPSVRVVDLRAGRWFEPRAASDICGERPRALVSSLTHANVIAIVAARLAWRATLR